MNKILVTLLLLLSLLPLAAVCLAQSDDQEQVWLPPNWVWGSGYTPYDYPVGASGHGYDPFIYYSHPGKTYNPYSDPFIYYNHPGKTYYPYSYSFYHYPDSAWYPYPYFYWDPYSYYSDYWWYR